MENLFVGSFLGSFAEYPSSIALLLAALLLAMTLSPVNGARVRWLLHCLALPIVFALAASPVLVLNSIPFH